MHFACATRATMEYPGRSVNCPAQRHQERHHARRSPRTIISDTRVVLELAMDVAGVEAANIKAIQGNSGHNIANLISAQM